MPVHASSPRLPDLQSAGQAGGQPEPRVYQDLEYAVRPKSSGLLNVVALWCGFEQLPAGAEERPPRFLVALRSNLPLPLPAVCIQVRLCAASWARLMLWQRQIVEQQQ